MYMYKTLTLVFCCADPWMMGAAASAFYINDAATVLPRSIVAKARTYLAGAYADVVEVIMSDIASLNTERLLFLHIYRFIYYISAIFRPLFHPSTQNTA